MVILKYFIYVQCQDDIRRVFQNRTPWVTQGDGRVSWDHPSLDVSVDLREGAGFTKASTED